MNLRGVRFAPSPTGTFHVGNLRTAWISAKIAASLKEAWVVRIEDIDAARVRADSWPAQLADLKMLGLSPGELKTQTHEYDRHAELFGRARSTGRVYACDCSRRDVLAQLATMTSAPHAQEPEYSGHCRHRDEPLANFHPKETLAWRWKSADPSGIHDAIVARTAADGSSFTPGYHWACAIDDANGAYHVLVRAWDLASADAIQREIRMWVSNGDVDPIVFHTALVTKNDGHRLEKRTRGVTLDEIIPRAMSVETLIQHFDSSFDLAHALNSIRASRRPAGEIAKSVTLSQLSI